MTGHTARRVVRVALLMPIRNPRQGKMTRHRSSRFILLMLSLTLTAAVLVAPGSASAGSLLSGYGGPGGGTQALLGSTLVGGRSSGAGGGGSSGASSALSGTQVSGAGSGVSSQGGGAGAGEGKGGPAATGASSGRAGAKHGGVSGSASTGTSAKGSAAYTSSGALRPSAGIVAARDSSPLGLTGTDVWLLVFVLGVLAITMGLTRAVARMQHNI